MRREMEPEEFLRRVFQASQYMREQREQDLAELRASGEAHGYTEEDARRWAEVADRAHELWKMALAGVSAELRGLGSQTPEGARSSASRMPQEGSETLPPRSAPPPPSKALCGADGAYGSCELPGGHPAEHRVDLGHGFVWWP